MEPKFKLSSILYGHALDVRCVIATNDNAIITASRDKTAKLWRPNGFNAGYTEAASYKDQKNFVICVTYLRPNTTFSNGLIITGGNDNTIYAYQPEVTKSLFQLTGHTNAISCLTVLSQCELISGSWDMTARIWKLGMKDSKTIATLTGHNSAVWAVIQLGDGNLATASADKTIRIWSKTGQHLFTLNGHEDCVRDLVDVPECRQLLSVSNDASVKLWNYSGENIRTYYGHSNYIYSIARFKNNDMEYFVTAGEDRSIRVWQNGIEVQCILVPTHSVWSVTCLSNGDIVTGSSDGIVRIFTHDEDRIADETTLAEFNEQLDVLSRQDNQEIGGYKVSDLPGKEALYQPGKTSGEVKMIREDNGLVAYEWVAHGNISDGQWQKIGDVLGGTDEENKNKTKFEGKYYDFVFTVDVEDGKPPLKLPYNKGEDPYTVAHQFLSKNFLPASYLEQVVEFILKNSSTQEQFPNTNSNYVDPFTGHSRYTPNTNQNGSHKSTKSTSNQQNNSYFPQQMYKTFDVGDSTVVLKKLKEFNASLVNNNLKVDEEILDTVIQICDSPTVDDNTYVFLLELLEWPDDIIFPVLDVVRMAVRHQNHNTFIASIEDGVILRKILKYIHPECNAINNTIVSLRILCNLFSYGDGSLLIMKNQLNVFEAISSLSELNKNVQVAISTVVLNFAVISTKKQDTKLIEQLSEFILTILMKITDSESIFRSLVALGTILKTASQCDNESLKVKLQSNSDFMKKLDTIESQNNSDLENKMINCARQLKILLCN